MRSFYSSRRFSRLEVLLALFLSAPISLNAQSAVGQAQASSPQSQPAQSARAAAPNAIASTEYASLLRRSSHFETRHTAGSASLS